MKKSSQSFHWNTVTPLSKYLAMVLFIIFPFVGFILGMKYQAINQVSFNSLSDQKQFVLNTPQPSPGQDNGSVSFSGDFINGFTKIMMDFKTYPYTIGNHGGFIRSSEAGIVYVNWAHIQFSSSVVNNAELRKRLNAYFEEAQPLNEFQDKVYKINGIKCLLGKAGKDPYNQENLVGLSIDCFENK